jgi:phosphopantetheinyl transferase (holo-ACP synthase)
LDSVGNDIVWLADPANRGRHADRRLLGRILTPPERVLVENAGEADRVLWSLWAAKEAAYKAWSRTFPGKPFSPATFEVVPEGPWADFLTSAEVRHQGDCFPVAWSHGSDWVHAVAGRDQESLFARVETGTGDESEAVRALAVGCLVAAGWPEGTIEGRPPRYRIAGRESGVDLSLSHDGPYWAVAFRYRLPIVSFGSHGESAFPKITD